MSINELHYFLWCSHGGTVAAENNLYDVETGVHSVMFYGDQFDTIDSNLLSDAFDYDNNQKPKFTGFDKLLTGGCPTVSYQDMVNDRLVLKTLLPPILFFVKKETDPTTFVANTNDKISYSNIMGLHYFNIRIENESYKIHEQTQILDWNDLLNNNVSTYSKIFGNIKKFCNTKNILPAHAIVGIYACRSFIEKYNGDYLPISLNRFLPTFANQNKHMPINLLYTWNVEDTTIGISPCIIKADYQTVKQTWSALAGLKHQGCALNVLSFFSIISQARAREESVCLNIRGTSIIEICKYINDYLLRMNISKHFIILRFKYEMGIRCIFQFLYGSPVLTGEATIVKFYSKLHHQQSGKLKFSNMGHTVAFGVYVTDKGTKMIYFLDPQSSENVDVYEWDPSQPSENPDIVINNFISEFNRVYNNQIQFMDIIFIFGVKKDFSDQGRMSLDSVEVQKLIDEDIITTSSSIYNDPNEQTDPNDQNDPSDPNDTRRIGVADNDLAGGNKKRIKKTKKKSSKKKKSRRRRQYRGGDVFITMSNQIDKKSNVKNLIN